MSHRQTFKEDYEFIVRKEDSYDEEHEAGYSVSLPHQCDSWEILGAEDDDTEKHNGSYPANPCSKELAVLQMELFIKRANEALQKLKELD